MRSLMCETQECRTVVKAYKLCQAHFHLDEGLSSTSDVDFELLVFLAVVDKNLVKVHEAYVVLGQLLFCKHDLSFGKLFAVVYNIFDLSNIRFSTGYHLNKMLNVYSDLGLTCLVECESVVVLLLRKFVTGDEFSDELNCYELV